VKDAFERTKSDYEDRLESLSNDPGNYYIQLRVQSAQMPSDPHECFAQPTEQFLRHLFFKNSMSA